MEAECENISEHYNEKCVETTDSDIPITTYSDTDTVSSYTHFVTHEHSTEILTNKEMNSYPTQEYTIETSTLSYTEGYSIDSANEINTSEETEVIKNQLQDQSSGIEKQENIQMDTSQSTDIENQNDNSQSTIEYKVEEAQLEEKIHEEIVNEKDVIMEEPVENTEKMEQISSTEEVTVEEIEEATLPGYETVDTLDASNVVVTEVDDSNLLVTEVDDSNSAHVDAVQTEEITDNIVKDECKPVENQPTNEEIIQENTIENVENHNMENSTEIAEGDLVIEELPSEHAEHTHEEPQEPAVQEEPQETAFHEPPQEIPDQEEHQETPLQEETHEYEVSEVKGEGINLPNTQVQEIENKESQISQTVIIETISDSHQTTTDHYTIIEAADSIDFSTNTIIEEVSGHHSFSEDLNSTVSDSYSQDDSLSQESIEEVIIIQETADDNPDDPDDPQPIESQQHIDKPAHEEPSASTKPRNRKGRKSTFDIPMHVLGHDMNKPVEPVVNGRAIPKPRLGVKVPYRNLTSQIVSKAEIEKEIMERGRLKMEQNKGDLKFARSLTQRLARKIAPADCEESVLNVSEERVTVVDDKKSGVGVVEQTQASIQNDSDLLAILEGDGDDSEMPVVQKEATTSPQVDESNLKALEREIALQQLSELPHQAPKQRIFRGKTSKPVVIALSNTLKEKSLTSNSNQQNISKEKNKENTTSPVITSTPKKEYVDLSPKKQPIDIEPQVKVNMVLKTYSRKRKISEPQDPLKDYPPPKKPVYDSADDLDVKMVTAEPPPKPPSPVYITKSSRVIKKKVIWDPDEVPVRSPKPSPRTKSPVPKSTPVVKTKTDKNSNTTEKVVEKKPVIDKKTPEKKIEKSQNEKKIEKPQSDKKPEKTPAKKSLSPKGSTGSKPKKIRSEIDKLLMDEGAVKMLYELNKTDEMGPKKKKDFYSVERAHKDIIKKANLLKNELEQTTSNDTQISLRKKEAVLASSASPSPVRAGPVLERKMSTTSLKSLGLTPPGSPFQHTQSSMLIRRRSSSSLSSSDDTEIEFKPRDLKRKSDTPKLKKFKKSEKDKSESEDSSNVSAKSAQMIKKHIKATVVEVKLNQYKSFTVKKTGKHVSVDLNYIDEKCYLTDEVLKEFISVLKRFAKDKDCNILTITSNSKAFCLGLDYTLLVEEDEEKRKELANELSEKVKDFLFSLLHFPKVLVACIQGDCVGLGVTMLPLFDMVVASDTATFTAPYASLGCIGEAGFLLNSPTMVGHLMASELLYTGQKMTADEAFRRGLISKLCWPEKYKETMKTLVGSIAKASKQSLEASKKQLRTHKIKEIEAAIDTEKHIWIEHWTSSECQEKFSELAESM